MKYYSFFYFYYLNLLFRIIYKYNTDTLSQSHYHLQFAADEH